MKLFVQKWGIGLLLLFSQLGKSQTYATLPFSDDLSSGSLSSAWSFSSVQGMGMYAVTNLSGGWPNFGTCSSAKCPNVGATGGNGVIVYNSSAPTGSNQINLDLHLNLNGAGTVTLSQAIVDWRSGYDSIGVWLSNDGGANFNHATTIKLWLNPHTDGIWNEVTLDLNTLAASAGVPFSSTYVVRYATFLEFRGSATNPKNWPNQSVYFDNFKGEELAALPVELTSFTGTVANDNTYLVWQTESEINNNYFEIQRSSDGMIWETIGTVNGQGNKQGKTSYSFIDEGGILGLTFYRLKQVDFNEDFAHSETISFDTGNGNVELKVLNNGSQPIVNVTGVDIAEISIFSMDGKLVVQKEATEGHGLILNFLSSGNYIATMNTNKGPISEKITIIR